MNDIKTWQERMREADAPAGYRHIEHQYIQAEIAELRAALEVERAALADAVRHVGNLKERLAARATPAQPVSAKTYQQRADDAGLTIRTKESLFDYAIAEITDLRAICKHDAAEQVDIAKRLRRVAKSAGVPVDGDDSFVYGVAFALLGQIASALESKPSPSSVGAAIRKLPLPEADYKFGTKGMLCEDAWTADQIRALLTEAVALAEQQGNEDTILLDWFDQQRTAYGFEGVQEGNEWLMNGPFATLRQALRECMAAAPQDGQKSENA